jgi:toxin-antitoxin system PIN domain toxin
MISLLDVNVLIALADADHPHASAALEFFKDHAVRDGWATCPLTENAFLRIFGNPKYPNGPGSPQEARRFLKSLLAAPGHQFWEDNISFNQDHLVRILPDAPHLTDCYLLALATSKGGRLATFDQGIDSSLVKGAKKSLHVINPSS